MPAGALKNSPGGCHCCAPVCGLWTIPHRLTFTINGNSYLLDGPAGGGTSGVWTGLSSYNIVAPGTSVISPVGCGTQAFVPMDVFFTAYSVPTFGRCYQLQLFATVESCQGSCVPRFWGSGATTGSNLAPQQVSVSAVLNTFVGSPFSTTWTFPAAWDTIPSLPSVVAGAGCTTPNVPLALTNPLAMPCTLKF